MGRDRPRTLDGGGIADSGIPARLVPEQGGDGSIKLAWELIIDASDSDDVWQIHIDAQDATEIDVENLTSADSYTVFEQPAEAPTFGNRSVATEPADPTAARLWCSTQTSTSRMNQSTARKRRSPTSSTGPT